MGNVCCGTNSPDKGAAPAAAEEIPPDAKAIFPLLDDASGPDLTPANPRLKVLLTSAGLMPTSAPEQLQAYGALTASCAGRGVLYLIDAKLKTLQWHEHVGMQASASSAHVAYQRVPDVPGGEPVRDAAGELVPKSQAELAQMGYHSLAYALHTLGHYSNGSLPVLLGDVQPGEEVPVLASYLGYDGDVRSGGEPEFKIMLARGSYKDGQFSMRRADGTGDYTADDYGRVPTDYSQTDGASLAFRSVSDAEFAEAVRAVGCVYSCGGVTWQSVINLQPYFINDGKVLHDHPNPYGKALLDAVREGSAVYVGQSAGSVCLSWNIGPLTTDPTDFKLETDAGVFEEMDLDFELGAMMLHPGLGHYLGLPYRLIFRPHLKFDPATCAYQGRACAAERLGDELDEGPARPKDVYCVTMADYDFPQGKGDALEVSAGKVRYHVGHCAAEDVLSDAAKARLRASKACAHLASAKTIRRQPPGNPTSGWAFEWHPSDGEVHAAGPKAKRPFRVYASMHGPMASMPPY
ncbi:hypothetical protein KFE25_008014 [Diacronema lutheri]|uniref:Uncharacterized protein n=1 Tax=Diacronema lutheri TaxID=2081491 RepID=A0A8J5XRL0_DIALT|nr:hypothetical protein KFE25_008014 [Diacronema lutheri]